MSKTTYNTILAILILVILAGTYIIFTHKEYTEEYIPTPAPELNTTPESTLEPTPVSAGPLPTFGDSVAATPEQTPAPKPATKAQAVGVPAAASETIHYTNGGFSPNTLTIKQGTTVTFINDTEQPMWVASAPYPSHSGYPSFNQRRAVLNGGMYSFTFTEIGGYNYQNDRNIANTGTIIVQ
jgi:plastocyanin